MHGSPEESILIDRQSTPQQNKNASPLLRQSSIGAKQVHACSFPTFSALGGVATIITLCHTKKCVSGAFHRMLLAAKPCCNEACTHVRVPWHDQ